MAGLCARSRSGSHSTFLHPHGPSSLFKYPEPRDIRTVPMDNVLTLVDPRTIEQAVFILYQRKFCLLLKNFALYQGEISLLFSLIGRSTSSLLCT